MVTRTESASRKSIVDAGARPGLTLAAVAVVQFMVSLDLSVVNVGLPQTGLGLGFSAAGLTIPRRASRPGLTGDPPHATTRQMKDHRRKVVQA
ncbi:hypothetical protein [Streptosporangium lutulentum]|uniref:MFS transporter n=1 Tax=Streptosporangium lutulentum TaxID=1461250 RepID=A0ABT9QDL3_9ACTN|nr:hypothetical protein [Streptosporangium lutulentum]MDP9844860.1 hypothetical protein [Streptosporangium lutulentum]